MRLWRPQRHDPAGVAEPHSERVEDPPSPPSPPYLLVQNHAEVQELAEAVLDPDREDLVVVLTSRGKDQWPPLDVDAVRAIVGPAARIYLLPTGGLSLDLSERLPGHLAPYNGSVGVWLPGFGPESNHREHPIVFDATGEYGMRALRQLAYGLRDALLVRGVEGQADPWLAYRSLQLVQVKDEADLKIHGLQEQLSQALEERDEAAQRARDESEEAVKRARKDRDQAIQRERQAERRARVAERDGGTGAQPHSR